MKDSLPLPTEKKLTVTYRVEPGCLGPEALGPNGKSHTERFCDFAEKSIANLDSDYIIWNITPRFDKSLPEMQFNVKGKLMNHDQAERYLQVFEKSLVEFEGHLSDKLTLLIDEFLGH